MKKIYYLVLLCLFALNSQVFAQVLMSEKNSSGPADSLSAEETKTADTLCFRYRFFQGDTLVYKVSTNDSLIHNMDKPIMKKRTEKIMVTCDSVDAKGYYHLIYQTISSEQKEWNLSGDTVTRKSSPWIGKRVKLVLDSLGNRIQSLNLDSNFIATANGGSFQPYLFFTLQENCKATGTSWLIKSADTLCENSFPPAKIEQTSLMRAIEKIKNETDTLAFLTFVKTAKGLYGFETDDISLSVQNVMNIYGELQIDLRDQVPVVYFVTQEEKIHFMMDDGSKIPAWHYSTTTFQLENLVREDQAIKEEIQKLKNQLKKRKK